LSLNLKTHTEHFTNPLYLESGRILEPYDIAYETYGELNEDKSNVVVVCHALTGSHHAAGLYDVTIKDMVKAQRILFDRLNIHRVYAIVGGSMGGMQALQFAIHYPNFAQKIISMAATYATQPWAIAFNKVAQDSILKDPDFKQGYYDPEVIAENGLSGMAVGRMAGHISFLSHESMQKKFGREYKATDGLYELFGKFQVESYLEYNGYNFTKWFDPLAYLYITKAINIFDLSRGFDNLKEAMKKVQAELHLISFKDDILFKNKEMKILNDVLNEVGNTNHNYIDVDSEYGHDAFLVELDKFDKYVKGVLNG